MAETMATVVNDEKLSLMAAEQIIKDVNGVHRKCGIEVGGNRLTLTNQRVVVKYWEQVCCGYDKLWFM